MMNTVERRHIFPFLWEHFYYLPLTWLAAVSDSAELDVYEMLFYHLHDESDSELVDQSRVPTLGHILFESKSAETTWQKPGSQRRKPKPRLFERSVYHKTLASLDAQGKVTKYTPDLSPPPELAQRQKDLKASPGQPSAQAWAREMDMVERAINREKRLTREKLSSIAYQIPDWPQLGPLVYRPRGYVENRWSAWLGPRNWRTRGILLALAHALTTRYTHEAISPTTAKTFLLEAKLTRVQILTWLRDYCPAAHSASNKPFSMDDVSQGVRELKLIGVVKEPNESSATQSAEIVWRSDAFEKLPAWSFDELAIRFDRDAMRDAQWFELFQDFMLYCHQPVTKAQSVWQIVDKERARSPHSPYVLSQTDLLNLRKFIRRQVHGKPPLKSEGGKQKARGQNILKPEVVLARFHAKYFDKRLRVQSETLQMVLDAISLAYTPQQSPSIQMPVTSSRGVDATQIYLYFSFPTELSDDVVLAALTNSHLIITQPQEGNDPIFITFPLHIRHVDEVQLGKMVGDTRLHNLDYACPFEMMLRCQNPNARIVVNARFVITYPTRTQSIRIKRSSS